ncbi:MAG TPA: hypothetical protein VIY49_39610 [Bryobacteraceae bacterium]
MKTTRRALGLPVLDGDALDDALLGALLRRASGILCPCSPATLSSTVAASLEGLAENRDAIVKRLTGITDSLMIYGDLLELSHTTIDDPAAKGTWVFAAPPSFAGGPGGSIFVLGTARDEITPLPASLSTRIVYRGPLRVLRPHPEEDLPAILGDLGFLQLPQSTWLKAPRLQSAADFLNSVSARLASQPASGEIQDLWILDPDSPADYYADRWRAPRNDTGEFVARRPQAYGAPIWGYASLSEGTSVRFLDLPLVNTPWRGCDVAWHLQMAIDACRGTPQHYRLRHTAQGHSLDFFSPLPMWAHRRMMVVGSPGPREKCLLAFQITEQDFQSERMFLQQHLWLMPRD